MEPSIQKKASGISVFGIFLILLGAGLILNKLHFLHYGWKTILWACLGIFGLAVVIHAFANRKRGNVFWGSLLFFVSISVLVHRLIILDSASLDFPATFSIALGLSFIMLFFYDPRRFGVLIPALFFGSYGVLYYLWWWDIIDWFDMKHYLFTYWPILIILWGLSLIFQRRK
jgi:hypothetical protein